MTVAFDAATPSGLGTSFTTTSPHTFDHTPSGTPRAVLVFITQEGSGTDSITGVTYGGVTMTRVPTNGFAADTAGESGASYAYFLGSSIPTGTQTVSITHSGSADPKVPYCISLTAAADTEIGASGRLQGDQANPQIALDTGVTASFRLGVLYTGANSPGDLTALTDVTLPGQSPRFDYGTKSGVCPIQTSAASSGSFTIGYTAASDDVAMIGVAVQEQSGQTVTAVTLTTTPSLPQAALAHSLTAVTLSATPTQPQASVTHSLTAVTLTATPTLPAATVSAIGPAPTFDAATESVHLAADGDDPHAFNHTPSGTPTGAVVFIAHGGTSSDLISGVTYGGTSMTRVQSVTDGGVSEPGRSYAYFLGTLVPSGTQSVSVDLASSPTDIWIVAVTLVGGTGAEVVDSDAVGAFGTNPQVSLQYGGRGAMALAGVFTGASAPTDLTPLSGMTAVHDHDLGVRSARVDRQTTGGTSDFTIGYTAASDEYALVALAIGTVGGDTSQTVTAVTLTVTPSLPQAALRHDLSAQTLTVTPTQPQATLRTDLTAVTLTVTPTLPQAVTQRYVVAVTLTTTPTQPQASLRTDVAAATLTASPTLPAAVLSTDLAAVTLITTPVLPQAEVTEAAADQVTPQPLSITPTFPTASLTTTLSAVTLTVTPTLPQAATQRYVVAVTLTVAPAQPAAAVAHELLAQTLTASPSQPAATLTAAITAVTLTTTPTLPQGTVQEEQPGVVQAIVLEVTPTFPQASLTVDLSAQTLTATPSLPQAAVTLPVDAQTLSTTPVLPAASISTQVAAGVHTVTPSLPTATLASGVAAQTLTVIPTFPAGFLTERVVAVTLEAQPVIPLAALTTDVLGQTLTVTPTFPRAIATALALGVPVRGPTGATSRNGRNGATVRNPRNLAEVR